MFIKTISSSKADVWDQCPYKYDMRYVSKVPEPGDANVEALEFGKYIHKVLEDGYQATTLEELVEIAKAVKPKYTISESYKGKDLKCFQNFLLFNAKLGETLSTEMRYEVPLVEGDMTGNGVIDRVIKGSEDGLLVIDYKTSKREKSKVDLYQDDQMKRYVYAINHMFGVPVENITVAHYYPLTNNFVHIKYSKQQIAAYVRSEIDRIWRIRKAKKENLTPRRNQFCNWCAYKSVCPEFNPTSKCQEKIKLLLEEKKQKALEENQK